MVRSFEALRSVDPGFSADGVLTFKVRPLPTKYADRGSRGAVLRPAHRAARSRSRRDARRRHQLAAFAVQLPQLTTVIEEFPPAEGEFPPVFTVRRTTPGYFEAMSIPLVEGRTFTSDDHNRRLGSAIISRSVKDRYWPDTSALGKRITVAGVPAQVVGVVGDVHVSASTSRRSSSCTCRCSTPRATHAPYQR